MDLIEIVQTSVENAKRDSNEISTALGILRDDYFHSHSTDSYSPEDYVKNKALDVASDDLIRFRHLNADSGSRECFVLDLQVAVEKGLLSQLEAVKIIGDLKKTINADYIVDEQAKLVGIIVNPSS